jgi:hypothetical protein
MVGSLPLEWGLQKMVEVSIDANIANGIYSDHIGSDDEHTDSQPEREQVNGWNERFRLPLVVAMAGGSSSTIIGSRLLYRRQWVCYKIAVLGRTNAIGG